MDSSCSGRQQGVRLLRFGLKEKEAWARGGEERRFYVGEWHSHPGGSTRPSAQDRLQMQEIADGPFGCPEPVLIVVAEGPVWEPSMAVWVFRRREEPVELVPPTKAGDLVS